MKQYGFTGKGTGKLGSAIFAISGGEQIVRQYNPVVANPQTEAQVAQRAKFKLLTQLAAAMSGQIAFRKSGLTSARNKFVSYNSKFATFNDLDNNEGVNIELESISLTGSSIAFPNIMPGSFAQGNLPVNLSYSTPESVSRVVYLVFRINDDKTLSFESQKVVSEAGESRRFPTTLENVNTKALIMAYGICDITQRATTTFENYHVEDNNEVAIVDVLRSLSYADYKLTATSAKAYNS